MCDITRLRAARCPSSSAECAPESRRCWRCPPGPPSFRVGGTTRQAAPCEAGSSPARWGWRGLKASPERAPGRSQAVLGPAEGPVPRGEDIPGPPVVGSAQRARGGLEFRSPGSLHRLCGWSLRRAASSPSHLPFGGWSGLPRQGHLPSSLSAWMEASCSLKWATALQKFLRQGLARC